MTRFAFLMLLTLLCGPAALAETLPARDEAPSAQRGYDLLLNKAFLPPDFDQETFDQIWRAWPQPLRKRAEAAAPDERRRMAFARYGLTPRPGDASGKPLQYVVDEAGAWTMNCFACHGGQVRGEVIPGLPNSLFALSTLTDDMRTIKVRLGKPLTRMDVGGMFMPLDAGQGVTNSVMFGVVLMAYRDAELNVYPQRPAPAMVHHGMDAPPWWHFKRRRSLYIDGFAPKSHRALMPFLMAKQNGPEKFRQWEQDFQDIRAYIDSLAPPEYPYPIDAALAAGGRLIFEQNCAECHGAYGDEASYPNRMIPIDEIGTDRVRLDALSVEHRAAYGASWFTDFGKQPVVEQPLGYVAPPLDGVWASAPYFHNGSVPTLWHVLHPGERPTVWRRTPTGYDAERVGLEIETFDAETFNTLPSEARTKQSRRRYYHTLDFGKSAAGHEFPDVLSDADKRAVLEYLKTL